VFETVELRLPVIELDKDAAFVVDASLLMVVEVSLYVVLGAKLVLLPVVKLYCDETLVKLLAVGKEDDL
jgi:hypothetical protein